jgi:RHS repeat-associated protein
VQSYSYDALNRLKQATENVTPNGGSQSLSWQQTYTFNRYGNRNFDETNTTTLPKECNGNTEVCEAVRPIVNPSVNAANNRLNGYAYDAGGNMTADPQGRRFTYDAENKQTDVRDQNNTVIGQYAYDGDGKRVKKIVPGTGEVTVFVYDVASKLIGEYSTVVQTGSNAKTVYTTNDHLGSPRINTDATGQVISRRDFHPFGEEISTAERTAALGYQPDTVRQKFTGYERDAETDLDFAQARMYNKNHGRFTAVDRLLESGEPIKPQTWNRYVYCLNNPLTLIDPDGQKWEFANEDLQKAFEEAVKAKGKKAWAAYQAIEKAKGTIKVGFGKLKENQFGDTNISVRWDKNRNLTEVSGSITISNDSKSLDVSNVTDLVSATSHEFNHVLSTLATYKIKGLSDLAPADTRTKKDKENGKASFAVENAAFEAQVNAEKNSIAKGNKPVSPDTDLGRANKGFSEAKTPTEKYDLLSGFGYNFKEAKPGAQPANQPSKTRKKP